MYDSVASHNSSNSSSSVMLISLKLNLFFLVVPSSDDQTIQDASQNTGLFFKCTLVSCSLFNVYFILDCYSSLHSVNRD